MIIEMFFNISTKGFLDKYNNIIVCVFPDACCCRPAVDSIVKHLGYISAEVPAVDKAVHCLIIGFVRFRKKVPYSDIFFFVERIFLLHLSAFCFFENIADDVPVIIS